MPKSKPLPKKSVTKKTQPALPAGFRDFGPAEVRRRRAFLGVLRAAFERYGYEPLETPAVELLSVLTDKYGEEGDKLLFRILNSGDFLASAPEAARQASHTLLPFITEKALRYDLTVPMARWVAQHAGELTFPFRRYQIQPVWRADRPQKGRLREFYQADVDIIGARGLMPLVELYHLTRQVFHEIGLTGCVFHLNHRALLEAYAKRLTWESRFFDFCRLLDKADKVGWAAVAASFAEAGTPLPATLHPDQPLTSEEVGDLVPEASEEILAALELVHAYAEDPVLRLQWDKTLARGLDYYTGFIYEVRKPGSGLGTLAAGGAYASLVQQFGGPDLPAMGFSFGVERILTLLPDRAASQQVQPWLVAWTDASPLYVQRVVEAVHALGRAAFAYPAPRRLAHQLEYAQRRGLPFAVIVGQTEEQAQLLTLKNLTYGTQTTLPLVQLADWARTSL